MRRQGCVRHRNSDQHAGTLISVGSRSHDSVTGSIHIRPFSPYCTVPYNKFKYCPICPFKETNVFHFTIADSCDARLSLHSYAISINHTKFHFSKTKTLFMVNFFHLFFDVYMIIDKKLLVMNLKNLIVHTCRKCQYTHHSFLEKSQKSCGILLTCNLRA